MVKMILALAGVAFVMGAILTSFDGSLPKVQSMRSDLAGGVSGFDKATRDYQADIEKLKAETPDRIRLNIQRLAAVKTQMGVKKYDQEYLKKIAVLEKRNNDMRLKMEYYRADGLDNWKVFKGNFNRDLDTLSKECRAMADQATKKI